MGKMSIVLLLVFVLLCGCATMPPGYQKIRTLALEKNLPVVFTLDPHAPDSVGGVDLSISYENISNKRIKYIIIGIVPYNAVNDMVTCDIRRESLFRGEITGPIEPGYLNTSSYFQNAWYNSSIERVELVSVKVIFMDGTAKEYTDKSILNRMVVNRY